MGDLIDDLRNLGSDVGPAGDEDRARIRRILVAEASRQTASAEGHLIRAERGLASIPTQREVEAQRRHSRWRGGRGLALIAALLAIPATIAIAAGSFGGDVSDNYAGFLSGEGNDPGPGRAVKPSDDPPKSYLEPGVDGRVLASEDDYRLFAKRDVDGDVTFEFGGQAYTGTGANPWTNEFRGDTVVPLIIGLPESGDTRLPVAGLVADGVASVELRYSSGPPDLISQPDDGFLFLADVGRMEVVHGLTQVDRRPVDVAASDDAGNLLQRVSVNCAGGPVLVVRPGAVAQVRDAGAC